MLQGKLRHEKTVKTRWWSLH